MENAELLRESDQNEQPEDEKIAVQKRTFTRWMNVFLEKQNPPLQVVDLFSDLRDGRMLMALLEELTGCKLLYRFRSSSHHALRWNNISKALAFLDDRHMELAGIDASGVADGIPSVILRLVWNIIFHFQVKEVTENLHRRLSSGPSALSVSGYPSASDPSPQPSDHSSYLSNTLPGNCSETANEPNGSEAINTLLKWVQSCTAKYGVDVHDFGESWRSGRAFLALIKSINPDLVDLKESLSKKPKENLQQAFTVAHRYLGLEPLLDPEDVACTSPDERSIIVYVSMFLWLLSCKDEDQTKAPEFSEIPNIPSHKFSNFRGTFTDDPDAQVLLRTFETSNEQTLWTRWCRKSSGSSFSNQRVLEPPSPLKAGLVNPEILEWLEKSLDHDYGKERIDGSCASFSPFEGIYSLSALDSNDEDVCSPILDPNRDVFQTYNLLKRSVTKVEEETEEEIRKESEHRGTSELFNDNQDHYHDKSLDRDNRSEVSVLRLKDTKDNGATMSKKIKDHIGEDESSRTLPSSAASRPCREERIHPSSAAFCGLTPSELERLLFFWILLYCCFILHQMTDPL